MSIPRIPGVPQRLADGAPTVDGQLQWYAADTVNVSSTRVFCVYVNGIMTDPAGHEQAALDISRRAPCLVLGGFNESGLPGSEAVIAFLGTIARQHLEPSSGSRPTLGAQRRMTMAGSAGLQWERTGYRQSSSIWDAANAAAAETARRAAVAQVLLDFCTSNLATGARTVVDLFHCMVEWLADVTSYFSQASSAVSAMVSEIVISFLRARCLAAYRIYQLVRDFPAELSPLVMVCHSEGNLNASTGLWALKLQSVALDTPFLRGQLQVLGLASPAPVWPSGVNYHFYRSDWDPVAVLGVTGSIRELESHPGPTAFPASHSVVDYVADPAFILGLRRALSLVPPEPTWVDGAGRGAATMSGRPRRR